MDEVLELIERARVEEWELLDLSNKNLTEIPPSLFTLKNLKILNLSQNKLSNIPKRVGKLKELILLSLFKNKISNISPQIGTLEKLTELILFENKLTQLPASIVNLKNLKRLLLAGNNLKRLPKNIQNLKNLEELILYNNPLLSVPIEIEKCTNLKKIDLQGNITTSSPIFLKKLVNLEYLDLSYALFTNIPENIIGLSNLKELNLSDINLKQKFKWIEKLTKLEKVNLSFTRFTKIPEEVAKLKNLKILTINNNEIISLPEWLDNLPKLETLELKNNPIPIPPEILETNDAQAILNFWRKSRTDSRPLNQGKMLLVGQGGVGKTSLAKKLISNEFDEKERMTEGINIDDWQLTVDDTEITAKVWDFGGQEVMHATHQFFLTERSLYLLVWDARQEDTYGQVDYWLKTIQSFGGNSPVIIVSNKNDDGGAKSLDEKALLRKYPNIFSIHKVSCKEDTGLKELKDDICKAYADMPHIRNPWPASWFNAKETLETKTTDHITFKDYKEICGANTVAEEDYRPLIEFLHDLGVVLCFREDPRLCETAVLNPEWVTGGVYKILNSDLAKELRGSLSVKSIKEILNNGSGYKGKEMFIIDMMKKFELCFVADEAGTYLIPELLEPNEPKLGWNEDECLVLSYHYNILPQSIISRFIVRMHNNIYLKTYWKNGVVLINNEGTNKALVRADPSDKTLSIYINGPVENRRDFIAEIRGNLGYIHKSFKELKAEAKVPVPNQPSILVPYEHLRMLENRGEKTFYPEGMDEKVEVKTLLTGVKPDIEKYTKEFVTLLRQLEKNAPDYAESLAQLSSEIDIEKLSQNKYSKKEKESFYARARKAIQSVPRGLDMIDSAVANIDRINQLLDLIPNL
ncbi:internalin A [Maridesulfovibrio ferrireducens]|uniref:non-specific serine/threonine protein kinase n=1 Tax=Maridesulfovibrio ferrireducens TaxID=246191 RepID=A0A1G9K9T0_9BACT|nr:COR domain-containing protein [Maridesulfovibrio ferrireducens]SDL46175.1 internalin A [Maridesulfovibrio ferrireducens]